MRIAVIGCGYLGATHAVAMAELGHDVAAVDTDRDKVAALNSARAPFYEPGLAPLLERHRRSGRLWFSTSVSAALAAARLVFVCVGTPQRAGSDAADLTQLDAAFAAALRAARPGAVLVGKSTVPVGTAARIADQAERAGCRLVWNPEFLREGHAVDDSLHPDRIVIGLRPGDEFARAAVCEVYATAIAAGTPFLSTDYATAELVKVAANAFLATKISFINAMAEVCEAADADVTELAHAIGIDERIGQRFLQAGLGFGGGCLPKDIRAFRARAGELGVQHAVRLLHTVDDINLGRREHAVRLAHELCGGSVRGRRVSVLGLAFKPHSDDIRDSPALAVALRLHDAGAQVSAFDPEAMHNAKDRYPLLSYAPSAVEACVGTDVVLHLTEWPEFGMLDPSEMRHVVAEPRLVDARNALDVKRWRAAGWTVRAMGRR